MKQNYIKTAEIVENLLVEYLNIEGINLLTADVSDEKIQSLLFAFTKDFLEHQLSFDDFSSLCEKLLVVLQNKKAGTDSDLYMICHYGAELSWYIRNEPVRAAEFLNKVIAYYKNNA